MEARVYKEFETLEADHWWFRGRRKVYLGVLAELLGEHQPETALDLGCGVGGFQAGLCELAGRVVASDFDHGSLQFCAGRGYQRLVQNDNAALPFAEDSFELVCLFDVIEHVEDDLAVMREIRRVLKPGGMVFLSVPAYQFLYANNDRVAGHYRRYTRSGLQSVIERSGLQPVHATYSNVLLFPPIAVAVMAIKVVEWLRGNRPDMTHSNLSWPVPGWLNSFLYRVFALELGVSKRWGWPLGHSLLVAARRV